MPRKPLNEEQKIKKRISQKKYRDANKEKIAIADKKYREDNIDLLREKARKHSENYRLNNPEKIKEYSKFYYNKNHMALTIKQWTKYTIICDDYDLIYRVYMATDKCEFCQEPFKDSYDRCLDHNHSILDSYNIRGILCRQCNFKDVLKDYAIKIYTEICE